jgi:hypothetical protein
LHRLIWSTTDLAGLEIYPSDNQIKMPQFSPGFGTSYRATIFHKIQDLVAENHANITFLTAVGDRKFDEIITYVTL